MNSSPSVSNSNKTFTATPSDNLSNSTTYKIRVTTGVKDSSGNNLSSQWTQTFGFRTTSSWSGTQQLGTSLGDKGEKVTVDSLDNIYITGQTEGGLDGNTNSGSWDIFLMKYNSSGVKQWTKQLGTSEFDNGKGLTVDSSDNIYVTGQTDGGLDGNTNSGRQDIFLVKYNLSGVKQWTQQLGTSSDEICLGVKVDSSDNIYVTGYTGGGLDGNTSSGSDDLFLVKYNSSGVKQWTQQLGTSSWDSGRGLTVDSSNNIYVTGSTYGGLDGNTNSGSYDIILVKYNSSGTKQWTQQLGTSSSEYGLGVTMDSSNNLYVTGQTNGGLDGNTNSGNSDIFLVKYNSSGVKQWTKQLGTSSSDEAFGITVDSLNNIYLTGYTGGGLDGNTNSGNDDIFLVKYNSSGTKQWTRQLGTSSDDYGFGVTVDSSNKIYVTGHTKLGIDGNSSSGDQDIFIVQYNSDGYLQTGDTTPPSVSSTSPSDNDTSVSVNSTISVTFSESIDNTTVTTNTSDTSCSGSIQVSSDSFSSCVQMNASPTVSNSNKTFTITPSDNLSYSTTYKIRVRTGVKDSSGNSLRSQYETSSGFTIRSEPSEIVTVGAGGIILTSSDGTSWTSRTSGTSNFTVFGVTYGNGLFVTVGEGGTILTSSNGTSWTQRTSGTTQYLMGVTYGNGQFVTVGDEGTILTSSNGTSWTQKTSGTTRYLYGVTYVNGLFVTVGSRGTILTSSDGTSWTSRTSGTSFLLRKVTFGNGLFVAVGEFGIIFTSSDGISWTSRTSGTSETIYGVTYGKGIFVSVCAKGIILTSSDGTSWSQSTSGTTQYFEGVNYGKGLFVAVGWSGIILTSSDGISWTSRTSGTTNYLYETTYSQ